ncbi:MAG: hypothetical protein H6914_06350 [Novosphingobium sp.]|nr:hypothetical protein [Novosphingobium sp.]
MLPSIDLRLKNMVKAVQDVIAPAIREDEKLAQEQARLLVGQIAMLRYQWKDAVRYEAGSFRLIRGLAETLVAQVDESQAQVLQQALDATDGVDELDIDALNAAICTLGNAIDKVILGDDGQKPLSAGARAAIIAYGEKDALRSRVWFQGNGIDPDREALPPLAEVI